MKKTKVYLLVIALLIILSACTPTKPANNYSNLHSKYKFIGKVIKIYDKTMLISNADNEINSGDLYLLSTDYNYDKEKIQAGAIIEIEHDGTILESYPSQFNNIKSIKFIEKQDDMVGFYEKVFDKLWETDKGLNSNIEILAFDLSKTTNLNESEKNALIYVLGSKCNLLTASGTFEQLRKDGYIDKDKLEFKNGILISFEVTKQSENNFMFNAEKWRSGTGAPGFKNCSMMPISFLSISISSGSSGAPERPCTQHAPKHWGRSQQKCFSKTSKLMSLSSI